MAPSPVPEILAELAAGRMIILVDDPSRENEGDLAMLAEHVTPAAINFMAREARGLVCMPLAGEVCDRLKLFPQVERNRSRMGTAFTVSIEAARGVTTGISAADRAHTIRSPPPRTWSARDTSFRCARVRVGSWSARARPRASSTSRAWPGQRPPPA